MKIEKIDIDELKKYENNAKEHPDWQIKGLAETIKKIGYRTPIIVDENNMILAGHGRYEALKKLEYKEVQVVKHADLTEEQKKAYIIADNKFTMNTEFDESILKAEIESLDEAEFDIEILGFSELELQELLDVNSFFEDDVDEEDLKEDYEEPNKNIKCPHCGYCGDKKEFKKE